MFPLLTANASGVSPAHSVVDLRAGIEQQTRDLLIARRNRGRERD